MKLYEPVPPPPPLSPFDVIRIHVLVTHNKTTLKVHITHKLEPLKLSALSLEREHAKVVMGKASIRFRKRNIYSTRLRNRVR